MTITGLQVCIKELYFCNTCIESSVAPPSFQGKPLYNPRKTTKKSKNKNAGWQPHLGPGVLWEASCDERVGTAWRQLVHLTCPVQNPQELNLWDVTEISGSCSLYFCAHLFTCWTNSLTRDHVPGPHLTSSRLPYFSHTVRFPAVTELSLSHCLYGGGSEATKGFLTQIHCSCQQKTVSLHVLIHFECKVQGLKMKKVWKSYFFPSHISYFLTISCLESSC